jgi:uncharacterized protein YbjT (DUF2867 family)
MFVVTGATGNTGSIVAGKLLEAGKSVRLLVRNPDKVQDLARRGAEVVRGDLWDEGTLSRALGGAEGLYLMSPPDSLADNFIEQRRGQLERAARSVRTAGLKHVVFLSSIGAQHARGTGPVQTLHDGEQALRQAGVPATFLRAAYFLENWVAVFPAARKDGVLPSFIPAGLAIPTVSTRDVGAVAARALLDGPRGARVVELAGPAEVSPSEIAAALGRLLDRPVAVGDAPLEAAVPTFRSFGFSEGVARLYAELFQAIRNGVLVWEGRGAEAARGTTTVEQALRPHLG